MCHETYRTINEILPSRSRLNSVICKLSKWYSVNEFGMVPSGSNWMHSYGHEGINIFLLNSYVSFATHSLLMIIFILITITSIHFRSNQAVPRPHQAQALTCSHTLFRKYPGSWALRSCLQIQVLFFYFFTTEDVLVIPQQYLPKSSRYFVRMGMRMKYRALQVRAYRG